MPTVGDRLSHYEILAKIGEGGMGEVFLAHDTSLERNVALKFLAGSLRQDQVSRQRFVREAKAAATLDHPHVCVVHEATEIDGLPFIVMEYVEGESLKQRLERGPVPIDEALALAAQIADAMEAAHTRHIVHRDLKPANVMVTQGGHIKVMDFGLAKRALAAAGTASDEVTVTGLTGQATTVGTLAYMSPEQFLGRPVDHRSDIFSFGVVVYEMLTGVHPFRKEGGMSTAAAIVGDEPVPPPQHLPGIPRPLGALLDEMLAKAPADRPQSMHAIRDRLKRILLDLQPRPEEKGPLRLRALGRSLRKPRVAVPAVVGLVGIVALGIWMASRQARVRWARETALPEIGRIVAANDVWRNLVPAYVLAQEAEKVIPDDPRLAELFARCSLNTTITTDPPGAKVYMKEYGTPEAEWTYLGTSPLEKVRVPIGIFRWRLERDGYETVLAASSTWAMNPEKAVKVQDMLVASPLVRALDEQGTLPPGMVRVQGGISGNVKLEGFYIDKHEVTNRQFKAFIDRGGYRNTEYWRHPITREGQALTWEEAAGEFVDQTGQPGPAQWQAGGYPEGQDDYPVSGVSWYEADAYCASAGKSLPTGSHWGVARGEGTPLIQVFQLGGAAVFAPFSNFSGKGPVAVGTLPGVTTYGAFDMAGNVREWCWNETPRGRLIRGGAWDDNIYMFGSRSQAPPMDRSMKNGFRCALYTDPARVPAAAFGPVTFASPADFYKQTPVSEAVFQIYREQFLYDKTDLNAKVESSSEHPGGWQHEAVTFDAAYGGERVLAHLFLPRNVRPPYQTVIYLPGSAALTRASSADIEEYYEYTMFLSFIVRNGRAALFPVYKGTFERSGPVLATLHVGNETRAYTDFLTEVVKDLSRSIDYLETRPDIDLGKLAYYGMSWGGWLGPLVTAVEPRFATSVLMGGALRARGRPEVNAINYVTRVRTSTLMLNGKYDNALDTGIKPLFDLLGTQDKKLVLDETDHIPSTNMFIRETLAWLDGHLGPVKR